MDIGLIILITLGIPVGLALAKLLIPSEDEIRERIARKAREVRKNK